MADLYICSSASSERKSMSILFRFSAFFAGMVGLHNSEDMGLHEACKMETTRFQSGEEMGLFPPLGSCTIFLRLSTKMTRFLESLFKCAEQFYPDFETEFTVSSV
jgi:hypothetical protein